MREFISYFYIFKILKCARRGKINLALKYSVKNKSYIVLMTDDLSARKQMAGGFPGKEDFNFFCPLPPLNQVDNIYRYIVQSLVIPRNVLIGGIALVGIALSLLGGGQIRPRGMPNSTSSILRFISSISARVFFCVFM